MMIELLNTTVAHFAMASSRWPIHIARLAELRGHAGSSTTSETVCEWISFPGIVWDVRHCSSSLSKKLERVIRSEYLRFCGWCQGLSGWLTGTCKVRICSKQALSVDRSLNIP
jgi:hypothetical protein